MMGSGSWCAGGERPSGFCAWSRHQLGWLQPSALGSSFALGPSHVRPEAGRLEASSPSSKVYFLLESRQRAGVDLELPGEGLLIWKIDDAHQANTRPDRYQVELQEANRQPPDNGDLREGRNQGSAEHSFPGGLQVRGFEWPAGQSSVKVAEIQEEKATGRAIGKSEGP